MSGSASDTQVERDLQSLKRRAEAILKARPAYRELVEFYLTVFARQIVWRTRLVVAPEVIDDEQRRQCLGAGKPLGECYSPGLDLDSLLAFWSAMKTVFRSGNDVLSQAVDTIDAAEQAGDFVPDVWLSEQRPERHELITQASRTIGIDESVVASLARAVTFPHWALVAQAWRPKECDYEWKRACCPTCGAAAGLAEIRAGGGGDQNIAAAPQRLLHCAFCGSRWSFPGLECPACGSTRPGDAKYYYTADEPELRIDFCKQCDQYVKVIDGDKINGQVHVGLELLTTAHLDAIATDKNLTPVGACG